MQAAGAGTKYNGVMDAYLSIAKSEGVSQGLYRGLAPNIVRNGIVNVCETVVYDVVKEGFITSRLLQDGMVCHFSSALVTIVERDLGSHIHGYHCRWLALLLLWWPVQLM